VLLARELNILDYWSKSVVPLQREYAHLDWTDAEREMELSF